MASLLLLGIPALIGSAPAAASTKIVTTSTGVRTHGSVKTTKENIGWLLQCPLSHRLPDDPITAPGRPGGAHLHDFTGNASTNAFSTLKSMENMANTGVADKFIGASVTAGTSCNMKTFAGGTAGDTAAYWRPTLYADGKPLTSTVKDQLYYRGDPLKPPFVPIPQDARLIVGSHMADSISGNQALVDEHLWWECNGSDHVHYAVPPKGCTTLLENVVFPSCWDGKSMDHNGVNGTDNHHFAYAGDHDCPAGFPFHIPQLSEKFKYDHVPPNATLTLSADPGEKSLAPMYTAHADFWNTWNPVALQYLVTRCLNARISCGTNPITPLS